MHFPPEFDPSKIDQWGPQIEEQVQAPSTLEQTSITDNANIPTPKLQKLIVKMTRGKAEMTSNLQANLRCDKQSSSQLINGDKMKPFITNDD